ncbi:hypothetical protein PEDI_23350 [Persicobacter diffluens]|uniref:Uncharacterized protein n=2 Tax=Persicobacter TaxID=59740 RepID=A0AAN5AME1_9BACT|nr:hypothetical protein PEDI_23350 [Persicobacter diffluens]
MAEAQTFFGYTIGNKLKEDLNKTTEIGGLPAKLVVKQYQGKIIYIGAHFDVTNKNDARLKDVKRAFIDKFHLTLKDYGHRELQTIKGITFAIDNKPARFSVSNQEGFKQKANAEKNAQKNSIQNMM